LLPQGLKLTLKIKPAKPQQGVPVTQGLLFKPPFKLLIARPAPRSLDRLRTGSLSLLLLMSGLTSAPAALAAETRPLLLLPNLYRPGIGLHDYWVSEKYDGVRGYWDGEKLLTRGGQRINTPAWFTAGWPTTPLDGELWAGRGRFQQTVSTVRQQTPADGAWRDLRFMVFDLPRETGTFTERLQTLNSMLSSLAVPWVQAVAQTRVTSDAALQTLLRQTVKLGGEGLMLHQGTSRYKGQRNDDLLKVKTHEDAEARVIEHIAGKGKYAGQMGALLVELPAEGNQPARRFKLGTGFTDAQRQNPPAPGTLVTYRFRGLSDNGLPRFASFMRVRED
jgi:DNA ligase-1